MSGMLRRGRASGLAIVLLGFVACSRNDSRPAPAPPAAAPAATAAQPDRFRDVTAESGLDATYRNGEEAGNLAILGSLGGGVALLDYDGDGLLDVFVPGGGYFAGPDKEEIHGHPGRLYKNLGMSSSLSCWGSSWMPLPYDYS